MRRQIDVWTAGDPDSAFPAWLGPAHPEQVAGPVCRALLAAGRREFLKSWTVSVLR
jgi:hypothetical protein